MTKYHNALKIFTFFVILAITLASVPASAAWGDALKQAGTTLADEQAKTAGLSYTPSEAMSGIRQVLSLGVESAVATLGQEGGFSIDPLRAIGLPDSLRALPGASSLTALLNAAAESAVIPTGDLFQAAVNGLQLTNPVPLVAGGSRAITEYFESASRQTLKAQAMPLVDKALAKAGLSGYTAAMAAAQKAAGADPFDVQGHVADAMLDAMFDLMGQKEEAIRSGGVEGATELLKKLF